MEGTDLWLAIAKRITLARGGKVPLESWDGVGVIRCGWPCRAAGESGEGVVNRSVSDYN